MAFSYSGDPAKSKLDEIRFLLQDTDEADALLSDQEINFLIKKYNSVPRLVTEACKILIAKFSRYYDETNGKVSLKYSQLADNYRQLLKEYESKLTEAPSIYIGGVYEKDYQQNQRDMDLVKPQFDDFIGDNPRVKRYNDN
jgi:hypothetical protein